MIFPFLVGQPAPGSSPFLLALLSVFAAAGGFTLLWQVYLRIKRGKMEDDELVARISNQVVSGAHDLLEEYRLELEVSKRQLQLYLDQVTELHRLLGASNARIARLEDRLRQGDEDRKDLQRQLDEALHRREALMREVHELQRRIEELERQLASP